MTKSSSIFLDKEKIWNYFHRKHPCIDRLSFDDGFSNALIELHEDNDIKEKFLPRLKWRCFDELKNKRKHHGLSKTNIEQSYHSEDNLKDLLLDLVQFDIENLREEMTKKNVNKSRRTKSIRRTISLIIRMSLHKLYHWQEINNLLDESYSKSQHYCMVNEWKEKISFLIKDYRGGFKNAGFLPHIFKKIYADKDKISLLKEDPILFFEEIAWIVENSFQIWCTEIEFIEETIKRLESINSQKLAVKIFN